MRSAPIMACTTYLYSTDEEEWPPWWCGGTSMGCELSLLLLHAHVGCPQAASVRRAANLCVCSSNKLSVRLWLPSAGYVCKAAHDRYLCVRHEFCAPAPSSDSNPSILGCPLAMETCVQHAPPVTHACSRGEERAKELEDAMSSWRHRRRSSASCSHTGTQGCSSSNSNARGRPSAGCGVPACTACTCKNKDSSTHFAVRATAAPHTH